jgi:hypothetical protein
LAHHKNGLGENNKPVVLNPSNGGRHECSLLFEFPNQTHLNRPAAAVKPAAAALKRLAGYFERWAGVIEGSAGAMKAPSGAMKRSAGDMKRSAGALFWCFIALLQ